MAAATGVGDAESRAAARKVDLASSFDWSTVPRSQGGTGGTDARESGGGGAPPSKGRRMERPPPATPLAELEDDAFFAGLSEGLNLRVSQQGLKEPAHPPPKTDDSIELMYNPILNCYFDPKTGPTSSTTTGKRGRRAVVQTAQTPPHRGEVSNGVFLSGRCLHRILGIAECVDGFIFTPFFLFIYLLIHGNN